MELNPIYISAVRGGVRGRGGEGVARDGTATQGTVYFVYNFKNGLPAPTQIRAFSFPGINRLPVLSIKPVLEIFP